jgi:hypothetical protein
MKNLNLIVLVVALVAIGLGTMLASGDRQSELSSEMVFVDLQKNIDGVDTVKIENASGVLLHAALVGGKWGAANNGQYPLDEENLIKLLNGLVQAKLDSAKTAKAENHSRLGLQDLAAKDSQATLLEVKAGEQSWQLLLGNTASSGNGVFIRKPSEAQTWLTKADLDLPTDGNEWLKQQILDLSDEQVTQVSRSTKEGKDDWIATKVVSEVNPAEEAVSGPAETTWELKNMPEGRELNYDSIVTNKVEDILELSLDELIQKKPMDFSEATLQSDIDVTTSDNGVINIKLYKSGEDNLVVYETVDPRYANSQWNKWVYKVSDFNAGKLTKDLESFLTDLPEEDIQEQETAENP